MAIDVVVLKNFGYPRTEGVRNAIRRFHRIKANEGKPFPGARGVMVEVVAGAVIEAPEDLLDSWLVAGLVWDPNAPDDVEEGLDG